MHAAANESVLATGHAHTIACYGDIGEHVGRGIAAISWFHAYLRWESLAKCVRGVLVMLAQGANTKLIDYRRTGGPGLCDSGRLVSIIGS